MTARKSFCGALPCDSGEALHAVLEQLGWKSGERVDRQLGGRVVVDSDGVDFGPMSAHNVWQLLKLRGLHDSLPCESGCHNADGSVR